MLIGHVSKLISSHCQSPDHVAETEHGEGYDEDQEGRPVVLRDPGVELAQARDLLVTLARDLPHPVGLDLEHGKVLEDDHDLGEDAGGEPDVQAGLRLCDRRPAPHGVEGVDQHQEGRHQQAHPPGHGVGGDVEGDHGHVDDEEGGEVEVEQVGPEAAGEADLEAGVAQRELGRGAVEDGVGRVELVLDRVVDHVLRH